MCGERETGLDEEAPTFEFDDVWLSYRSGEPVLKGISFHVRPGEKIALVGATGGGKTSIISALCRFYDVDRGSVRVDGIDVRQWNKQELRRHLSLVLQDVFLIEKDSKRFPDTKGWAYAVFDYDPQKASFTPNKTGTVNCGFQCHTIVAKKDYIFTAYGTR